MTSLITSLVNLLFRKSTPDTFGSNNNDSGNDDGVDVDVVDGNSDYETDNIIHLVFIDGDFDNQSKNVIDELDKDFAGFKEIIMDISKEFYCFHHAYNGGSVNYTTTLTGIKGLVVEVNIQGTPPPPPPPSEKIDDDTIYHPSNHDEHTFASLFI